MKTIMSNLGVDLRKEAERLINPEGPIYTGAVYCRAAMAEAVAKKMFEVCTTQQTKKLASRDVATICSLDGVDYCVKEFDKDEFVSNMCKKFLLNPTDVDYKACCYILAIMNYIRITPASIVYDVSKDVKDRAADVAKAALNGARGTLKSFFQSIECALPFGIYAMYSDLGNAIERFNCFTNEDLPEWLNYYTRRVVHDIPINFCKPYDVLCKNYIGCDKEFWWKDTVKEVFDVYAPSANDLSLYDQALTIINRSVDSVDVADYFEKLEVEELFNTMRLDSNSEVSIGHIAKAVLNAHGSLIDTDEDSYKKIVILAAYYVTMPECYYQYELDKIIDRM